MPHHVKGHLILRTVTSSEHKHTLESKRVIELVTNASGRWFRFRVINLEKSFGLDCSFEKEHQVEENSPRSGGQEFLEMVGMNVAEQLKAVDLPIGIKRDTK